MRRTVNPRVLYTLFSALIIIAGSVIAIRFAQGYRPSQNGSFQGNGLLAANSFPSGGEIYINGKLVGVTDNNTLYLSPGQYKVEILKDGYTPWQKTIQIQKELVTQTNAQLFRRVTGLTPLTFAGVKNIWPSPDGQKLLFYTASASAQTKNGLYLLDLSSNFLSQTHDPQQIAGETLGVDLSKALFVWSPENNQVVLSTGEKELLLDLSKQNDLSALPDISFRKKQLLSEWESELYLRERQYMSRFPDEVIQIATESAKNVYLSPDKMKIMYTATAAATLPDNLEPALPASDTQPEHRMIQPGMTYVYDRQEDKNFSISLDSVDKPAPLSTASATLASKVILASDLFHKDAANLAASPSAFVRLQGVAAIDTAEKFRNYYSSLYSTGVQWFPDSKHIFYTNQNKIYITEYDNTNKTVVYDGPFADNFVYPWPDGSRLLILTTFSASSPMNLYAIELK